MRVLPSGHWLTRAGNGSAKGARAAPNNRPAGRIWGIWAPTNELVSFAYDPGGRLLEKWLPNGVSTRYTYNPDNTLAQVLSRHGSTVLSQHDYTYDGPGDWARGHVGQGT